MRERRLGFQREWNYLVKENFRRKRMGLDPLPCKRSVLKHKYGILPPEIALKTGLMEDTKDEWEDMKDEEKDACEKDGEEEDSCKDNADVLIEERKENAEVVAIDISEETEMDEQSSTSKKQKQQKKERFTSLKDMIKKTGTVPVWLNRKVAKKIKRANKMTAKKLKK